MRFSNIFPKSVKDAPKDEVSINAKLLIRGGFIDKLMAGSYTLLPLGRRVERKIEQIIKEEMDNIGGLEVLMPLLHPKEIWNETGRWDSAKEVMYKFEKDNKEYALSFTHEEIVLDLIRKNLTSYKDLPIKIYHFSTKFRQELRAKSGILRGREFLMKDLYSAHVSEEDLMKFYWQVADVYIKVFTRMGLNVHITQADGGVFTKDNSHEFQLETEAGEDTIYHSSKFKYWKNKEVMTDDDYKLEDLKSVKSIEVGNIFPLGTSFAEKMGVYFQDKDGSRKPVWFGSYGIGLTRLVGAIVESSNDEKGIIWPESVSPFRVHLVGLHEKAEEVYKRLLENKIEVLFDDRDISAGQKFAEADLIGISTRLVVSAKTTIDDEVKVEWKDRANDEQKLLSVNEVIDILNNK